MGLHMLAPLVTSLKHKYGMPINTIKAYINLENIINSKFNSQQVTNVLNEERR